MQKFIDNLKRQAEDNPMLAVGVGAAFVQATTKLLSASAQHRNSKAWKKEVDRRTKSSRK